MFEAEDIRMPSSSFQQVLSKNTPWKQAATRSPEQWNRMLERIPGLRQQNTLLRLSWFWDIVCDVPNQLWPAWQDWFQNICPTNPTFDDIPDLPRN